MIIDTEFGTHDDLVLPALSKLSDEDSTRARADVKAHLAALREAVGAMNRGVRVAPYWRRPLPLVFEGEAERREKLGDATGSVWAAMAERSALYNVFDAITDSLTSGD